MKKQKEAAEASLVKATADAMHQHDPNTIQPIIRPKGEVGDKKCGFELRTTMKLEGKEHMLRFNLVRVEIRELRPEVVAESDEVLVHYRSRTNG